MITSQWLVSYRVPLKNETALFDPILFLGLSQDFETGCLKLAFVEFLGIQIFKGDHNILSFQP